MTNSLTEDLVQPSGVTGEQAPGKPDPWLVRKQAEAVLRARATREALAFRRALADIVIAKLGIASALTASDVHFHLRRILAGSGGVAFLDETMAELCRRRITLIGQLPPPEHLAACLGSPMMSVLIQGRLAELTAPARPEWAGSAAG